MAREPSVVGLNRKLQEHVGVALCFFFFIFVIYYIYIYLINKSSNHVHSLEITALIKEKEERKIIHYYHYKMIRLKYIYAHV
jgi:TRAP-type C4-dicarboxylate transport system permease small subunit